MLLLQLLLLIKLVIECTYLTLIHQVSLKGRKFFTRGLLLHFNLFLIIYKIHAIAVINNLLAILVSAAIVETLSLF